MSITTTPESSTTSIHTRTTGRRTTIVTAAIALLAGAGIVTGIVAGVAWSAPATPPATSVSAGTSMPDGYVPATAGHTAGTVTPAHGTTPAKPVTPVTPVAPTAAIRTLQTELGQLNYYEGPVTGVMNARTTQAITYLQLDAHLPQTGTMTSATQAALTSMLATGNNQMGS
ncbi:MAG: peptidoglycan-binding protein [Pseudonocardia sp.]|nr:peptidoglycan-binding protein [Pseudonocardia sp.]